MERKRDPLLRAAFGLLLVSAAGALIALATKPRGEVRSADTTEPGPIAVTAVSKANTSRADDYRSLQLAIETRLKKASGGTELERAWLEVRGLGRRASADARSLLNRLSVSFDDAAAFGDVPVWAGSEPRTALLVTLLETGTATSRLPLETLNPKIETDAPDARTLAWRIELAGLLHRTRPDDANSKRQLARMLETGLGWLERQVDPSSPAYAELAQAVFRAAPRVMDFSSTAKLRRTYAKLTAGRGEPVEGETLLQLASRLEAMSSFALLSKSMQGGLDARLAAALRAHREKLVTHSSWRQRDPRSPTADYADVAALRALRLSRAVLVD